MSTNGPGEAQPEYLEHGGPATNPVEGHAGPGRRTGIVAGAALAVVAAVGIGGYGLVQLMAGGSSPATVVPADTLGYVSLDLDPSAGQKIEAFRIMRKFPSLKKGLHLGGQDDIRRAIMEQIVEAGGCKRLSYSRDVEPWIGDRVAFAAVPDRAEGAVPLIALQVSDQARAKKGIRAIGSCEGSGSQPGVSFAGDYALITDTQPDADRMAKDAKAASLADDADFKTWTGRTGDPGIVTMYVSKAAPAAIAKSGHHDRPGLNPLGGPLDGAFKNFQGGAGVIRFHDGAVEAEFTTKGVQNPAGADTAGQQAATLPDTTAAAVSMAFKKGWLRSHLHTLRWLTGSEDGDAAFDTRLRGWSQQTGLDLPADIETALGNGVTLSVDSSIDLSRFDTGSGPDPSTLPVGLRISGDPATIAPTVTKLVKALAGPAASGVTVTSGNGYVAVGTDPAYLDTLVKQGDLGGSAAFKRTVAESDHAALVGYVDFDTADWAEKAADLVSGGDPDAKADVAPLHALGLSGWVDGDGVQHGLLRLTTD